MSERACTRCGVVYEVTQNYIKANGYREWFLLV
jgi:uncharacterized C2H2 Zn-finger protein